MIAFFRLPAASSQTRPAKWKDVLRWYQRPPSFTSLLPWMEYDPHHQVFRLEDGQSCAVLLELTPAGVEARPERYLEAMRDNLQEVLCDAIPEEEEAPWVLQCYVQDDPNLSDILKRLQATLSVTRKTTAYTERYLGVLEQHLERIAQYGGIFDDREVTGSRWQGQARRVRAVLYRRLRAQSSSVHGLPPAEEVIEVAAKLTDSLRAAGIRVRQATGEDLYQWLLPWFNPAPAVAHGKPLHLLKTAPYPGDDDLPFGADFSEWLVPSQPRSEGSCWWFDHLPHQVVTLQGLRKSPVIGHLTAERATAGHVLALFDQLPAATILAMTITFQPQDHVRRHLDQIHHAAAGENPEAILAREETDDARMEIARGNKLYPVDMAFYLRAINPKLLRQALHQLHALLLTHGLQPIADEADLLAQDSYLRYLPMNFDPTLNRSRQRSKLMFSRHIAALLPLYGRSTGTGKPGLLFYNRGGEPFCFDPIADRKANAHLLVLGPTGAGKSALLVYCLMQMMAVYRPRVFIIDAGGSFSLLAQYFASLELTVHQVTMRPNSDVSLPPFAHALKLLDSERRIDPTLGLEEEESLDSELPEDDVRRDLLGEMEIAARLMITGGEPREENRMTRQDRLLIREAILQAANTVRSHGRDRVLTEDVATALREIPRTGRASERAEEMADSLALFCSPGSLEAHFFNRPGQPWPEVDVTLFEMGILAQEGYEDKLTVAYVSLMNHIHSLVERHQYTDRPTIVLTDEGHLITTNPLLAPYLVKITKMWRKFGCWLWIATQNLEDFPNAAKRMLNMLEWWLCLVMPIEEVENIARFKELTEEQRALLLAARKEPGKYTEGVVLGKSFNALFRNVPPPLALALAMTEQHEKAERMAIMRERNCTELEAAYIVAERLTKRSETL